MVEVYKIALPKDKLMAIFGWATAKQAVHYVEEANQPKIASSAMHLIVANDG